MNDSTKPVDWPLWINMYWNPFIYSCAADNVCLWLNISITKQETTLRPSRCGSSPVSVLPQQLCYNRTIAGLWDRYKLSARIDLHILSPQPCSSFGIVTPGSLAGAQSSWRTPWEPYTLRGHTKLIKDLIIPDTLPILWLAAVIWQNAVMLVSLCTHMLPCQHNVALRPYRC